MFYDSERIRTNTISISSSSVHSFSQYQHSFSLRSSATPPSLVSWVSIETIIFVVYFASASKLTRRWKTSGLIFIICRVLEATRQAMNRFPLFEFVLWIKEPSRVPGKWLFSIKPRESNAYHLKGSLNFTMQTISVGNEEKEIEDKSVMRVLVLKVSVRRIRKVQYWQEDDRVHPKHSPTFCSTNEILIADDWPVSSSRICINRLPKPFPTEMYRSPYQTQDAQTREKKTSIHPEEGWKMAASRWLSKRKKCNCSYKVRH